MCVHAQDTSVLNAHLSELSIELRVCRILGKVGKMTVFSIVHDKAPISRTWVLI